MNNIDISLYLVTDPHLSKGRSTESIVEEAVKGGVTAVQLREKDASTLEFYHIAKKVKKVLEGKYIPLIINDRIDIALAIDADGVHIGQSDMPYDVARRLLGNDKIIGLSVESIEQAQAANELDVDYIGISPIFLTPTKTNTAPGMGYNGILEISKFTKHKTVAIGGINKSNTDRVINSGADGIAVVSAIVSADSPMLAAQELKEIVEHAKIS